MSALKNSHPSVEEYLESASLHTLPVYVNVIKARHVIETFTNRVPRTL